MYGVTQCFGEVSFFFIMGNVGVVVVVKCEEPKEVLSLYREGVGKCIVIIFSFLSCC